jgi:hypothetical protein
VCIDGCFRCLQGLWPNYIKVVPSIALAFTTYELLKEMMGAPLSSGLLLECRVDLAYRRRSSSFDDSFTAQLAGLPSRFTQHYHRNTSACGQQHSNVVHMLKLGCCITTGVQLRISS